MIVRYNMYPAAAINGAPGPGISSGQAIDMMDASRQATDLPPSMRTEWTELALLQLQTGNTAMIVFVLAVVLVFLVLAAQYESWSLPFSVILVVPMCLLCSVVGVQMAEMDINIFTQIGFIVLVGLACKNAILIVEFAKARREEGVPRYQATLDACKLRLRPIMMTSFAFILGVVPLVVSEGAGSEMRRTLGTAVFGGMLGVTLFGIFLTPVFYYVIQWVNDSDLRRPWASHPPRPETAITATVASTTTKIRPAEHAVGPVQVDQPKPTLTRLMKHPVSVDARRSGIDRHHDRLWLRISRSGLRGPFDLGLAVIDVGRRHRAALPLKVVGQPGDHPEVVVEPRGRPEVAVAFARVEDQPDGGLASDLEEPVEFERLAGKDPRVFLAVEDQERRPGLLDVDRSGYVRAEACQSSQGRRRAWTRYSSSGMSVVPVLEILSEIPTNITPAAKRSE